MKKEKTQHQKDNECKANIIRCMVQDMLDGISYGCSIDLDKFEKNILKIINTKDIR